MSLKKLCDTYATKMVFKQIQNNDRNGFVLNGDCLDLMKKLPANSVDSVVTDPPYGLGFMGKEWDKGVPGVEFWREAFRVLKPGGHLVAFAGTRTQHRMATAIEDAGFEIRDMLAWIYGSGFPKSHDVSKALDKKLGAIRDVVGIKMGNTIGSDLYKSNFGVIHGKHIPITTAHTESAKQYEGWGTALKPALEPITLARKPFKTTVADNVLVHGVGAINIDGCRVEGECAKKWQTPRGGIWSTDSEAKSELVDSGLGRWPANLMHDGSDCMDDILGDAKKFFYCPKANKKDRDEGLDNIDEKSITPYCEKGNRREGRDGTGTYKPRRNHHPTVKPTDLMAWLCRLVTPKNGIILDPFTGSGSTGKAADREGFRFVGMELDPEYVKIASIRSKTV